MSTIPPEPLSRFLNLGTIPPAMAGDVHDNRAIGERLEIIRRSMKVSQEVLSERLEPLLGGEVMTAQKWSNYAKGRDRIPVPVAIAVCTLSGVDLDYIYRNEWGSLTPQVAGRLQEAISHPVKRFRRP